MASTDLHPSELAYAFAFARIEAPIAWGQDVFLPSGEKDGDPSDWLGLGEERLRAAGRLIGTPENGLNFTDAMTEAILTLVNPGLVLLGQRKAGTGVRTMTVHAAADRFIGLIRHPDGIFEMTRYAELTAAAGACAGFVGASLAPLQTQVRIETDAKVLSGLKAMAKGGETAKAMAALTQLGAPATEADSLVHALAAPANAGVVSVLYCTANAVEDVEAFSVMTDAEGRTWVVFAPAGPDGPVIVERSSAAALTARVSVGVVARLSAPR